LVGFNSYRHWFDVDSSLQLSRVVGSNIFVALDFDYTLGWYIRASVIIGKIWIFGLSL